MSKEKWVKALLSTDPSEKTNATKVLKAGAAHAGLRGIQAFISKTVEEKSDIIWEFQQEVNPYEADGAEEAEEATEEEAPKEKKKRRTIKRGAKAKAKEEPAEEDAPDEAEDAPDEEEEKPKAKRGRGKAKAAEVDMGPVMAELNVIKEQLVLQARALADQDKVHEKMVSRMSDLDKWVKETHCVLRVFALTSPGVYENLTNSVVVEELYGKSAFEEESEGNE